MNLQFADWNGDGHEDILTATFEGKVFFAPGGPEGFAAPEYVEDGEGRHVLLSLYWDNEDRRYANRDCSPKGRKNPEDHCVSATAWDIDADGDLDLLLGAKEGRLYLQRNEGRPGEPRLTGVNEPVKVGDADFHLESGLTAARVADWDGDGLEDLVCGGFDGGVWWFRNAGEKGAPRFEPGALLFAPKPASKEVSDHPEKGVYAVPVDQDGDGDLDLLLGGYAMHHPEPPELDAAQKARLAEIEAELEAGQKEMSQLLNALYARVEKLPEAEREAARRKGFSEGEIKACRERTVALRSEREKLAPRPKRVAGVWLLERRDG